MCSLFNEYIQQELNIHGFHSDPVSRYRATSESCILGTTAAFCYAEGCTQYECGAREGCHISEVHYCISLSGTEQR